VPSTAPLVTDDLPEKVSFWFSVFAVATPLAVKYMLRIRNSRSSVKAQETVYPTGPYYSVKLDEISKGGETSAYCRKPAVCPLRVLPVLYAQGTAAGEAMCGREAPLSTEVSRERGGSCWSVVRNQRILATSARSVLWTTDVMEVKKKKKKKRPKKREGKKGDGRRERRKGKCEEKVAWKSMIHPSRTLRGAFSKAQRQDGPSRLSRFNGSESALGQTTARHDEDPTELAGATAIAKAVSHVRTISLDASHLDLQPHPWSAARILVILTLFMRPRVAPLKPAVRQCRR
jgi:hypothetical protein